jgi:hypothetical protein
VARAVVAGLPWPFTLENNYILRVTAQDATTGAVVTDVIASEVSISVDQEDVTTPPVEQKPGEIFLIPGPAMAT